MLGKNTYHDTDEAARLAAQFAGSGMDVRLNEIDRKAVDLLLSGETVEGQSVPTPQMNAAKRVISVLAAMPTEEPPTTLLAATLRKITAGQVVSAQNPPSTSAGAH